MYNLITIQGKYAPHYRFKRQSAQSFKGLIQGITGNCCTVISSRFRSDLIYCSDQLTHKEALKLWTLHIKGEVSRKQRHLFIFKSGKQAVLEHYFTSLNELCRIPDWYREYAEEFIELMAMDTRNPVLRIIADCENYLTSNDYAQDRPPLIEKRVASQAMDDGRIVTMLKDGLKKPERNN